MVKRKTGRGGKKDSQKPIKAAPASVAKGDTTLSSFQRQASYQDLYKLQQDLSQLRTKMVLCAISMQQIYGDSFCHSAQLMGASDMVQDWIEGIRAEYSEAANETN